MAPGCQEKSGVPARKTHFPAFAVIAGLTSRGRIPPRLGVAAAESGRRRWFSRAHLPAFARISPRKFTEIYRKTPLIYLNLSNFTEIPYLRTKRSAPPSYRNPPNPREPQMRGNARASRWGRIHSGQGGKASREFPAGPGREGRRAASPAYPGDAKTRRRQMRVNAWAVCPADGLCHHRRLTAASLSQRFFRFTKACGIRQRSIRRP